MARNCFLYDALHRQQIQLTAKLGETVNIYCCGPTVYNYIHLGNARPVMTMDLLVRFLRWDNYHVNYVQNITDIDDKIINKALQSHQSEKAVTAFFSDAYINDLKKMNVLLPDQFIYVQNIIPEIQAFISRLILKKVAYVVDGNVYFDIEKYGQEYGKLAKKKLGDLLVGDRIDVDLNKRNPFDFVLWKKTTTGQKWDSPWGAGRPGWHTECVVIIDSVFKNEPLTIHAGGVDLKFPHHENERIQYFGLYDKELSKIWMHNGHLNYQDEKMSKSLGNVVLVHEFLQQHSPDVLRWLFMTKNYRQPFNLTEDLINQADKFFAKLVNLKKRMLKFQISHIQNAEWPEFSPDVKIGKLNFSRDYEEEFRLMMYDDLNTSQVLSLLEHLIWELNSTLTPKGSESPQIDWALPLPIGDLTILNLYRFLTEFLGILGFKIDMQIKISDINKKLYHDWMEAHKAQDFVLADKLRRQLQKKGLV